MSMGLVSIDIKSVKFFRWWFLLTLVSTIVSEAFFRLFLLESIIRLYKAKFNVLYAIIIVSIIFALMHSFYGSAHYMLLAFIASIYI